MSVFFILLLGIAVGLIARAVLPNRQFMGVGMTALFGVGGAFLGSLVATLVTSTSLHGFHWAGAIGAVVGALVSLVLTTLVSQRATV